MPSTHNRNKKWTCLQTDIWLQNTVTWFNIRFWKVINKVLIISQKSSTAAGSFPYLRAYITNCRVRYVMTWVPCALSVQHTCSAAWAPALTFLSSSSTTHPRLTALVKEYVLPQLDERLWPQPSEESWKTRFRQRRGTKQYVVLTQNHLKRQKQKKRGNCHALPSFQHGICVYWSLNRAILFTMFYSTYCSHRWQ